MPIYTIAGCRTGRFREHKTLSEAAQTVCGTEALIISTPENMMSQLSETDFEDLRVRFKISPEDWPKSRKDQAELLFSGIAVYLKGRFIGLRSNPATKNFDVAQTEEKEANMAKKNEEVSTDEAPTRVAIDKTKVIVVTPEDKVKAKPPRGGSKVDQIVKCYKDGMTVEDFLAKVKDLGGGLGDIRRDLENGRIKLKKAS